MIAKRTRKLKPEARAAMGAAGKAAQQRRWGSPRPDSTTVRVSKDVAELFRREIPEYARRTEADAAMMMAIRSWQSGSPLSTQTETPVV